MSRNAPGIRLFEWVMSYIMLAISVIIAFDPNAVPRGGFHLIEGVWLTPHVLLSLFLVAGTIRMSCLYANGRLPHLGPWCRAGCSFVGAMVWGEMCASLWSWSGLAGYHSLGIAVYSGLAGGEAYSCFRSVSDGGSR